MILDTSELKAARTSRGVSQTQLAAKSGVHVVVISRIECGRSGATVETMRALTEALGIVVKVSE